MDNNERNGSRAKSLLPMLLLPVIFIAVISFFFNSGGAKDNGAGPNFTVNADADPGFFQKLKDKVGL